VHACDRTFAMCAVALQPFEDFRFNDGKCDPEVMSVSVCSLKLVQERVRICMHMRAFVLQCIPHLNVCAQIKMSETCVKEGIAWAWAVYALQIHVLQNDWQICQKNAEL
jgi:hypothetical protein